jgi:hypothetical protein
MSTITTNTFQELATGDSVGAKYVVRGSAKAWANLNGTGTIALRDSLNVASVVDNGVGDYTFSQTSAFAAANQVSTASTSRDASVNQVGCFITNSSAGSIRVQEIAGGTLYDVNLVCLSVMGDLA